VKCNTVDVLRIKPRLSPKFKASSSGGYRDVLVNLRFPLLESPLDTYIVEVQLHLSSYLRLKKEEIGGHKTYRVARDLHIFDESVTKPLISEVERRQLYGVSTGTLVLFYLHQFILNHFTSSYGARPHHQHTHTHTQVLYKY